MDLDPVDGFGASLDGTGNEVDALGDFLNVLIDDGMEAAFGKDVDQHAQRSRIVEHRVFRVHYRAAGEGVAGNDRQELRFDQIDNAKEQVGMFDLVAIEPAD